MGQDPACLCNTHLVNDQKIGPNGAKGEMIKRKFVHLSCDLSLWLTFVWMHACLCKFSTVTRQSVILTRRRTKASTKSTLKFFFSFFRYTEKLLALHRVKPYPCRHQCGNRYGFHMLLRRFSVLLRANTCLGFLCGYSFAAKAQRGVKGVLFLARRRRDLELHRSQ